MATPLTQDQLSRAVEWIKARSGKMQCGICRHRKFTIEPHTVTPPIIDAGGNIALSGTSYPFVMMVCSNCGNTYFFNAVKLGIFAGDDASSPL